MELFQNMLQESHPAAESESNLLELIPAIEQQYIEAPIKKSIYYQTKNLISEPNAT